MIRFLLAALTACMILGGQQTASPAAGRAGQAHSRDEAAASSSYVLGPGDQIVVRARNVDEITDRPVRVDTDGSIHLPVLGRVEVSGLTLREVELTLAKRLQTVVLHPEVTVTIADFGSQPVSVLGAVKNPGVYQLQGRKSLVEALSLAGGLDAAAASTVKITRSMQWGSLSLPNARADASGQYTTAELSIGSILNAEHPEQNIVLRPHDVISVPRAEMVYVVGQVQRAGGFPLTDRRDITVLQALSLAGGLDRAAKPNKAMLLRRTSSGQTERAEIAVDLTKILNGKAPDVPMRPEDILFVPNSTPKRAALRALEAAVQMGTGVAIWKM